MLDTLLAHVSTFPDALHNHDSASLALLLEGVGLASLFAPAKPGGEHNPSSDELAALLATARAQREQEARYRALARTLPDVAVFLFDHDLRFLVAEGAALEAQGYRREAVEGRTLGEVLPPERFAALAPRYRAILAGEDLDFTREQGDRVYQVRGRPIRDERGAVVAGLLVSQDVTNRQQVESALQLSESRSRTILGALREGVVLQDAQGCIVEANLAAERLLGLTADQLRGLTSLDPRWHAVREDGTPCPGAEHPAVIALQTGVAQRDVVMGVHIPDGALIWLLVTAEPLFVSADERPSGVVASFVDITARKRMEDALRASEERFRSAFEYAAIGKALVALDGRLLRVNRVLCTLLDYSEAELLATDFQTLTYPEDLDLDLDHIRMLLAGESPTYQIEKRYRRRDGSLVWGLLSVSLVRDEAGAPLYLIGQVQDIDARKRAEEALRASEARLAHLAMHDALTGLPNRRRLAEAIGQALARLRRGGPPVALLCLDLDGFKAVNDALGHEAGDALLVTIADRLRASVRDGDTPGRLGGDELAVLLEGPGAEVAGAVAARLVAAMAIPVRIGPTTMVVTASAGVALATTDDTPDDLLRRADAALYDAKRGGKNRYSIATV